LEIGITTAAFTYKRPQHAAFGLSSSKPPPITCLFPCHCFVCKVAVLV